jgi:hypothetical protein
VPKDPDGDPAVDADGVTSVRTFSVRTFSVWPVSVWMVLV